MGRLYNRSRQVPLRQSLRTNGTPSEARLWSLLQRGQVGGLRFRRQYGVGLYVLDFYCPSARLGVELDGSVHDAPEQAAHDQARTQHLAKVGIRVVRFENRDLLSRPEAVVAEIARAAAEPPHWPRE